MMQYNRTKYDMTGCTACSCDYYCILQQSFPTVHNDRKDYERTWNNRYLKGDLYTSQLPIIPAHMDVCVHTVHLSTTYIHTCHYQFRYKIDSHKVLWGEEILDIVE